MKARPFILRCVAFLLILVFSQKSGAGLFFHNLLHGGNSASEIPSKQHDNNSKELSYACTCIDDFLIPFDGSEEPVNTLSVSIQIVPNTFLEDRIPFYTSVLPTLRGPPSSKA